MFAEEKQLKWDRRMVELAEHISIWSHDPSTKIGAVIANDQFVVVGMGVNGFPRGLDDDPVLYADRDYKLDHVIHAELNAILNANGAVKGCTLYLNGLPPCVRCAVHIIQAGIERVVYTAPTKNLPERWVAPMNAGRIAFENAEIPLVYMGEVA